jgi:lipopolysaccharide/colanic/teichoic acid biosynthesis glycosyltransferase
MSMSIAVSEVTVTSRSSRVTEITCRALDIAVATLCLLVLLPVLLVVAVAIRLDSPGWVIFRQKRVGRDMESFTINKFRTMRADAGHETHRAYVARLIKGEAETYKAGEEAVFKLAGDTRVTRLGRFLRRSSIDELPQLWNVIRGDMSLVGPRPPIHYEVDHYQPPWFERFAVKPGLTGLWQVSGRSSTTFEEMIELDIDYVRRRSFWLNVWILVRTVPAIVLQRGVA